MRPGDSVDVSPLADDGVVLDQWQDANSGGLGGAGSITRQKVRTYFDDSIEFRTLRAGGFV